MGALWLGLCTAAVAVRLEFQAWPPDSGEYVSVTNADGDGPLTCKNDSRLVLQLNPDSVLVEGAVEGRPKPLQDYGTGTGASFRERLLFESGMFIPELDPCSQYPAITYPDSAGNPRSKYLLEYAMYPRQRNGNGCEGGYLQAWYSYVDLEPYAGAGKRLDQYGFFDRLTSSDVRYFAKQMKYSPTGALNLREAGSVSANNIAFTQLGRLLPAGAYRTADTLPFSAFNAVTRSMWGILKDDGDDTPTTAWPFAGMVPTLHPVFDGLANFDVFDQGCTSKANCKHNPTRRDQKAKQYGAAQRIVVKRCSGDSEKCCLALEGDPINGKVDTPYLSPAVQVVTDETRPEFRLRWNIVAVHTSFARGIPDLRHYSKETMTADFELSENRRPSPLVPGKDNSNVKEVLQRYFDKIQANGHFDEGASGEDYSDVTDSKLYEHNYNGVKCVKEDGNSKVNFRLAQYLEPFYTALVGDEEKQALSQEHVFEAFDRKIYEKDTDRSFDSACKHMPGGHCGHGYTCDSETMSSSKTKAHDNIFCMPKASMFKHRSNYRPDGTYQEHSNAYNFYTNAPSGNIPFDKTEGDTFTDNDGYRTDFENNPISGKYLGQYQCGSDWYGCLTASMRLFQATTDDNTNAYGGNLFSSDQPNLPLEEENLFRKRVRGRPELVQWFGDGIEYSGNRGRNVENPLNVEISGRAWKCQWPPADRSHRYCNDKGSSYSTSDSAHANNALNGFGAHDAEGFNAVPAAYCRVQLRDNEPESGCFVTGPATSTTTMVYNSQCYWSGGSGGIETNAWWGGGTNGQYVCKPRFWRCIWPPRRGEEPDGTYPGDGQSSSFCAHDGLMKSGEDACTGYDATDPDKVYTYGANGCMWAGNHGCKWSDDFKEGKGGWDCVSDLEDEFRTRATYMSYGDSYYHHALDSISVSGRRGLGLRHRMSARDVFTYGAGIAGGSDSGKAGKPDADLEGYAGSPAPTRYRANLPVPRSNMKTMLPCRGSRGVERACYNIKATKVEWLIAAM
jgi:hypothetical protein